MQTIWGFVFPALEQKGVSNVVLTKIVRTPGYRNKLPYSAIRLNLLLSSVFLVTEGTYLSETTQAGVI
jgi:hypothetical protein